MTLPIERARSRRPVTWLTLIGVLLLPVVIGGILVAALYNPAERLDGMSAAIVNEDEPVTIDDQYVPLGRQLTAGLVEGSDDIASNLDWTISNADDAADGLADGTYQAVVTIPENFSAAATSTHPAARRSRRRSRCRRRPTAYRRRRHHRAGDLGRGIHHGPAALAGVPRERVPRLHDARRPARRGRRRRARSSPTARSRRRTARPRSPGGTAQLERRRVAARLRRRRSSAADSTRSPPGSRLGVDGATAARARRSTRRPRQVEADRSSCRRADHAYASAADQPALARRRARRRSRARALAADVGALRGLQCPRSATRHRVLRQPRRAAAGTSAALPRRHAGGAATAPARRTATPRPTQSGIRTLTAADERRSDRCRRRRARSRAASTSSPAAPTSPPRARASSRVGRVAARRRQRRARRRARHRSPTASRSSPRAPTSSPTGSDRHPPPSRPTRTTTRRASPTSSPTRSTPTASARRCSAHPPIPLLAMLALWFGGLGTFVALQAVSRRALTSRAPSARARPARLRAGRRARRRAGPAGRRHRAARRLLRLGRLVDVRRRSASLAGVAFAAVNQALVAVFGGAGRWLAALVGVLTVATGVVSTVPGVLSDASRRSCPPRPPTTACSRR